MKPAVLLTALSFLLVGSGAGAQGLCGQGVSFGSPIDCAVRNGSYQWTVFDNTAFHPMNGSLFNYQVNSGYFNLGFHTVVGHNVELQINDNAFVGNDTWALLGILDLQGTSGNLGGQATSGIVRGNWAGTQLAAGLRSQAENYSGRAQWGLVIGSSQQFGNNEFDTGIDIQDSYTYGIKICGVGHRCPGIPLSIQNGAGATLMSVDNAGAVQTGNNNITGFVPPCNTANIGKQFFVVDAQSVSYQATYVPGGTGKVSIVCQGSFWYVH